MIRKAFAAPFWVMLLMGLTLIGMQAYFLLQVSRAGYGYLSASVQWVARLFFPVITVIEAIFYWRVRKWNVYRKMSWVHIFLFVFAYFSPYIKKVILAFYLRTNPERWKAVSVGNLAQVGVFYIAMITAHIFFFRVMIKIAADKRAALLRDPTVNLLDDVLN